MGGYRTANVGVRRDSIGRILEANRGTLYLEDVDALPLSLQDQLLVILSEGRITPTGYEESRRVDFRFIASSQRPLADAVKAGAMSETFYKTISEVSIDVPALRDRAEDVPLLVDHFLGHFGATLDATVRSVDDDALERLTNYAWPGNLRELENVVERAVILADSERITLRELPENIATAPPSADDAPVDTYSLRSARRRAEARAIERALRATDGNRTHAAERLGISHRALLYKIKEYRLS
jgi:two-component system response regulator AtoC